MNLSPLAIQDDYLTLNQAGHEIGSALRYHHVLALRAQYSLLSSKGQLTDRHVWQRHVI